MGGAAVPVSTALFLYGTLCHAPLREAVLGLGHVVSEARLAGHQVLWAEEGDYPVLVPGAGEVTGLLVEALGETDRARADFFELGFGYVVEPVEVAVEGRGLVPALVYRPPTGLATGAAWALGDWAERWGSIWVEAAGEAMRGFGEVAPEALAQRWTMMKQRAATRLRAAQVPGHDLRSDYQAARDVRIETRRYPYTNYFSLEDHDLRFRRFDGSMSQVVRRAGFVGGDAATVLPYDPALDAVLVVEQFRTGPLLRGDPRPWTLEPIAGRIDPGESPEACVRREAIEETGLNLGRLHHVANYYPSPGAVTEFVFSYVAEAQLDGRGGEVGGVASEDEDIRSHLLSLDQLMALIASGEANTGPLILSALWLVQNRTRLRGKA